MKLTIFHLELKYMKVSDFYYTSLTALVLDGKDIGISKSYLQKYDWSQPFENEFCIIKKGFALSTGDVRSLNRCPKP